MAKKKNEVKAVSRFARLVELINFALNNSSTFGIKVDNGGCAITNTVIKNLQEKNYVLDKEDMLKIFTYNEELKCLQFINNRSYVKSLKPTLETEESLKDLKKKE